MMKDRSEHERQVADLEKMIEELHLAVAQSNAIDRSISAMSLNVSTDNQLSQE